MVGIVDDFLMFREGYIGIWVGKDFCMWGSRGGCFLEKIYKDLLKSKSLL